MVNVCYGLECEFYCIDEIHEEGIHCTNEERCFCKKGHRFFNFGEKNENEGKEYCG